MVEIPQIVKGHNQLLIKSNKNFIDLHTVRHGFGPADHALLPTVPPTPIQDLPVRPFQWKRQPVLGHGKTVCNVERVNLAFFKKNNTMNLVPALCKFEKFLRVC